MTNKKNDSIEEASAADASELTEGEFIGAVMQNINSIQVASNKIAGSIDVEESRKEIELSLTALTVLYNSNPELYVARFL